MKKHAELHHMTKDEMHKAVDYIMDTFNFDKVHQAMLALDWEWHSFSPHRVPTTKDLRIRAREHLVKIWEKKTEFSGSGGLWAEYRRYPDGATMKLTFVVTQAYADENGEPV